MSNDYIIVGGELYHADDFLAHYGVKGMKWGIRKDTKPGGGLKQLLKSKKQKLAEQKAEKELNDRRKAFEQQAVDELNAPGYHTAQKKRRQQLTPEQSDAELTEMHKHWMSHEGYDATRKDHREAWKLGCETQRDAYDWYFDTAATPAIRKAVDSRRSDEDQYSKSYLDRVSSEVLKEMGYADTPKARELIVDFYLVD